MYGIVNKAIEGLMLENFGAEKWEQIKLKSGVQFERFLSHEQYDDSVTYNLAIAASDVLQMPLHDVLVAFGKYWINQTAKKHYGSLMTSGGQNFGEFLLNLPNFHSRVMLLYPNIKPPEFKCEQLNSSEILLHYYSTRPALAPFVEGLIHGLGDMFNQKISVELIRSRDNGHDHEEFLIKY